MRTLAVFLLALICLIFTAAPAQAQGKGAIAGRVTDSSNGILQGAQIDVEPSGLTDEVFGFYQGSPRYMIQREYYRPTIAAGFRWSPTHER